MISIIIFLFLVISNIHAHEVNYEIREGNAVLIKVVYGDDDSMSYAKVRIFSPDSEIEFQNGRTDKNGCFAFLPDKTGEWKITVNDETGHGIGTKLKVNQTMNIKTISKRWHRWQKLVTGISIIWGLTGLFLYLKVRRKIG
ncbi:MAG: hypothetical protein AB1498_06395 [bacterium]